MSEQTYHYFASSAAGWGVGDTIDEAVECCRRNSKMGRSKDSIVPTHLIALVPGNKSSTYELSDYAPQVDGCIFLTDMGGKFDLPDTACDGIPRSATK